MHLWSCPSESSRTCTGLEKLLLAQSREGQSEDTENRNNGIKLECMVLTNFLNPTKRAKHKNSHYSPIRYGCMNNHIGRAKLKTFESYWTAEAVQRL